MAAKKKTPAEQAARAVGRDTDETAAGKLQRLSSAGERSTYAEAEPTSPNYGGPYLVQTLAGE